MPDHDIAQMAHLMRRAGFGAARDELEERAAKGYEQTVEELLDPDRYGAPRIDPGILFRTFPYIESGVADRGSTRHIWYLINNPRPLEEKVALFWHTVFATGTVKIDNPLETARQLDMFRRCGLGSYRDLLVELASDPAMIYWLDNYTNHKNRPNENWGRELLELFSMGQGNYTERDVFECARAFTGWGIAPKPPDNVGLGRYTWDFQYLPEDHDDSEKTFLGHVGRFNGEDVIDIIVRQPATARFIARHLYNFFVADEVQVPSWLDTPPRDPIAVNLIADAFISSGYDIRSTLRVIFNSDFFKEARFQRVKSPAELVAGICRLVGDFKYPRPDLEQLGVECAFMGQALSDPPSVEGWHFGAEWIDAGSLVKRISYASEVVSSLEYPGIQAIVNSIKQKGDLSPDELVDTCLDVLGSVEVYPETRNELLGLAELGDGLRWTTEESTQESARKVADMLAVIVATREYQLC